MRDEDGELVVDLDSTKIAMTRVLNEYVKCGVIGVACDRAGIGRRQHANWLSNYPQYKEMYETMRERFVDGLELVAIERAKEKSDSLMITMLKAHRGDVYNDNSRLELSGQVAAPITLMFAEGMLTQREKDMLAEPPAVIQEENNG
jgi:hypothetical protein